MRGFFAIGIENTKCESNIGSLFRTAHSMGAQYIFTIGNRYQRQQSDTTKSYNSIPLFSYKTFGEFKSSIPKSTKLIGIEIDDRGKKLYSFVHPERSIYLLGAEDIGLSEESINECDCIVEIPDCKYCLNVAVTGSIILYDRLLKGNKI